MKKIIAGVMGFLMMGMIVVEAGAASRVSSSSRSYSSSSSRSYSSPSRSNYSAPKSYSAPAASAPSRQSNPTLKSMGFARPASTQTVSKPSAGLSSSRPTSTVSTGWFGKKSVSSAPARQVSSPVAYRSVSSSPRTTVIQRNYYSNSYGGHNGYNRGYGGYGYNPYGGYSSGGSSFLYGAAGAMGGMMLYNALSTPHHNVNSGAIAAQIEQAKTDQRIEDKLDMQNQLLMQQRQPTVATAPVVMQQPQCFLPPDAPLMMSPQFYCGVNNAN
jgi:hypothetical protein